MTRKQQRQADFDKAWHGVIAQGGPGVMFNDWQRRAVPCYQADNGDRCGVGHVLGDAAATWSEGDVGDVLQPYEHMQKETDDGEHVNYDETPGWYRRLMPRHIHDDIKFYDRLQWAHDAGVIGGIDRNDFIKMFKEQMTRMAVEYDLQVPPVTQE